MPTEYCPVCKEVLDFKNVMVYDDKQMKVEGIVYMIQCLKCKSHFISKMRMGKKAKEVKKVLKDMEKKLGRKK